ncbi:hypothetical protein [Hyalangium gracile]|uniref:hypothetical protein n=1 Tax=Hyalangium gracile TaxID=394092 RepID=UPI001CCF5FF6|nr:hypothetical protein [Hyalangium gracile]
MNQSVSLNAGLQSLGEATAAQLKLTPEQQALLANHVDAVSAATPAAMALGKSIDMPFSVSVVGGTGTLTTAKQTTAWATITGYAQITAPSNGSWSIQVIDIAQGGRTVLSANGVTPGQQVPFQYKTGFSCQLKISVQWSEGGDTTLEGQIHASY